MDNNPDDKNNVEDIPSIKIIEKREPVYLTAREAAAKLRYSLDTLYGLKYRKKGPPFHKAGGKLLYDQDELIEYIKSHKTSFSK
jgi:hypothetical protein